MCEDAPGRGGTGHLPLIRGGVLAEGSHSTVVHSHGHTV